MAPNEGSEPRGPNLWSAETGSVDRTLLALVHGSMDRSAGLLRLSRRLDARFRVLRYDRRGYGRSQAHRGPFDIDAQVEDLVALLGGRPAVLFGHSYGGNVVLALADRHPHLARAAVVYESPMSWLPWWPTTSAGGRALSGGTDPAEAAEEFMRALIGPDRWDRLPPSTRAARRAEGHAMVGELAALRTGAPWRADRIRIPVLAMSGANGAEHHRRAMDQLASEIADAERIVIPEARHFGPNTHPDAVADALVALVDRIA